MSDGFTDIALPVAPASAVTADQVTHGPSIPPQQRILLYSAAEWEGFIEEWAHFALKGLYVQVQRFTGAGDRGIDIAGFADAQKLLGAWDNYQCKRFLGHAIYPSEAWPEIGKILWHSFNKEYRAPRRYYFVAPHGVGTTLASLLANPPKLKKALIENWDKSVRHAITDKQEVPLEGAFLAYVEAFDFSIFDAKTGLQVIEGHRQCPCHSSRFGGGLPSRPAADKPPAAIAPAESRYVAQLLSAYADHKKEAVPDVNALKAWPKLDSHFGRQREAFYHAESLRVFARDSVPAGTFESLQDDIHTGVVDVCDDDHADAYERVKQVTQAARGLHLTSNALLTCSKPKDRDGICHQLANEDRLLWMKS
ncbi:MAG TPA: ABC-three component system protein [Terriglobales bacterium]|nr:ABC-three component system protein [Terriglobales bacterium]